MVLMHSNAGKIVGKVFKMDQYINGKKYSIKRFRFDKELYKRKMSPWRDVGFAAHHANGFEIEQRPLGEGAGESYLLMVKSISNS